MQNQAHISPSKEQQRERNKEVTARIHKLLASDPKYRDDDNLLMNRVQYDEIISMGLDPKQVPVYDFFRFRIKNLITDEDTITRLRRKVQEEHPETRGEKYKKRQAKQAEVQDDLRDLGSHMHNNNNNNASAHTYSRECCNQTLH